MLLGAPAGPLPTAAQRSHKRQGWHERSLSKKTDQPSHSRQKSTINCKLAEFLALTSAPYLQGSSSVSPSPVFFIMCFAAPCLLGPAECDPTLTWLLWRHHPLPGHRPCFLIAFCQTAEGLSCLWEASQEDILQAKSHVNNNKKRYPTLANNYTALFFSITISGNETVQILSKTLHSFFFFFFHLSGHKTIKLNTNCCFATYLLNWKNIIIGRNSKAPGAKSGMKRCFPPAPVRPTAGHTVWAWHTGGKGPHSVFPEKHTEGQKDGVSNKIQRFIEQNGARQCSLYIQWTRE